MASRSHTAQGARPCRGCGAVVVVGRVARYCEACRDRPRCPRCAKVGGGHLRWCPPLRRPLRRAQRPRYDEVSIDDILAAYTEHRAHLVQLAQRIVGAEAEDVVHNVTLYLIETRHHLRQTGMVAYFHTAVKHSALRHLQYARSRLTVAMDPEGLVVAEAMMERGRRGHPIETLVRFPDDAEA